MDEEYISAGPAVCEDSFSSILEAASMSGVPLLFTSKNREDFIIMRSDTYGELLDMIQTVSEIDPQSDPLIANIGKI